MKIALAPGAGAVLCGVALVTCPAVGATAPPQTGLPPEQGQQQTSWNYPAELPFSEDLVERLQVPEGFRLNVFAKDLGHARMLLPLDDGRILLSRPMTNDVVLLRDDDNDGAADEVIGVASGLGNVHGMARDGDQVYLAGEHSVWVADLAADGTLSAPRTLVSDLPVGAQHPYRTIGVHDGWLYVSIGSSCNDCNETDPEHATMLRMRPDGTERSIHARGLRNTIGFGWHPQTGDLWGMDHGTDWRGDELPPEELNRIVRDGNYGWPFCWGKAAIDGTRGDPQGTTREAFCAASEPPVREFPAHSAPIGMSFYQGDAFPADYRDDAFIAMRGSWNRSQPREPRIVRIQFEDGQPTGEQDFVSGFLTDDGKSWFGRLAGVAVDSDGALFFSDDMNGVVYRVTHGTDSAAGTGAGAAETNALERIAHVTGFDIPESVLHDDEQDVYFVSNIGGKLHAKDNNGRIARLAPDGQVQDAKFITGTDDAPLHSPKGMAIAGSLLWVSDIDRVLAFDRVTGAPVHVVEVAGSTFLNDVAAAPDGSIYVSDTGLNFDADGVPSHTGPDRIVRIDADGNAEVVLETAALGGPNGLLWDNERNALLIAQMFGKDVLTWTPGSATPTVLESGVGRFDGLARAGNGELLVSSGHDSVIYVLRDDRLLPLMASPPTPADIGIDTRRNRLLIPSLAGNWVEIWQLPVE